MAKIGAQPMASSALDRIVESLMSGKLAADDFLRAVEAEIEGTEARVGHVAVSGTNHP